MDTGRQIFGAFGHQYALNPPKKEPEVAWFEQQNGIKLPEGYRAFLLQVANGGTGPYYGLLRLESTRLHDIDYPDASKMLDSRQPFPHTEAWNLDDTPENEQAFEEEYFAPKQANGLLRMANYGCGISINMVVNGPDYGKMWVDDRANDGGFYPDHLLGNEQRLEFLDWYELWLDQSIAEISAKASEPGIGGRAPG
ncbi:MAG: SMI1/KNR4 family protein [Bacteroidia bacterium]